MRNFWTEGEKKILRKNIERYCKQEAIARTAETLHRTTQSVRSKLTALESDKHLSNSIIPKASLMQKIRTKFTGFAQPYKFEG